MKENPERGICGFEKTFYMCPANQMGSSGPKSGIMAYDKEAHRFQGLSTILKYLTVKDYLTLLASSNWGSQSFL